MRWNRSQGVKKFQEGGVAGGMAGGTADHYREAYNKSAHGQIDALIDESDSFAPLQKLMGMTQAFPEMDMQSLLKMMELISAGGDTLTVDDYNNVNDYWSHLTSLNLRMQHPTESRNPQITKELNRLIQEDPGKFDAIYKQAVKSEMGYQSGGRVSGLGAHPNAARSLFRK